MRKECLPDGQVRIYIHSGGLSFDNGAVHPLRFYFDLCKLPGVIQETGTAYYDDSIVASEIDAHTIVDLLTEAKMLYKIEGQHDDWQNVLTPKVAKIVKSWW